MKRVWLLILAAAIIGTGLLVGRTELGKAVTGLFAAEQAVYSIRYTLEVEAGRERYEATSVVQTFVYQKPEWAPDLGERYQYRYRGEGLGIRFDDGRAMAVRLPALWLPPDYKPYDKDVVARFAAEQKSFPIDLRPVGSGPPEAFVFDDAVAPRQAWRLDWMHPERTLGPGVRIVRFDMTPTRDPPTFDLGKAVPWVVAERRASPRQMFAGDKDSWYGFETFRAKLTNFEARREAREIVLITQVDQTKWLDATDIFAHRYMSSLVREVEPIGVRYSDDFGRITFLPDEAPTPTLFIQRARMMRRQPRSQVEYWTPVICILRAGCADILVRPSGLSKMTGALINPVNDLVYIAHLDGFTTVNTRFQIDELAR
jgi:hypothetical protein